MTYTTLKQCDTSQRRCHRGVKVKQMSVRKNLNLTLSLSVCLVQWFGHISCEPGLRFSQRISIGYWSPRSRGLINSIDNKADCRHLKKLNCKGTLRQGVYQNLYTGEAVSHIGIFDPAVWTVALLTFSLVQLPPLPCVNKYTVYTYTVCKGGEWGSGPQTDKQLPQSSFTGQFF